MKNSENDSDEYNEKATAKVFIHQSIDDIAAKKRHAERCREYRERKKLSNDIAAKKKHAERCREYRERKKLSNDIAAKKRHAERCREYRKRKKLNQTEKSTDDDIATKKTQAERCKEYRERKKLSQTEKSTDNDIAAKKRHAERCREYRARKKNEQVYDAIIGTETASQRYKVYRESTKISQLLELSSNEHIIEIPRFPMSAINRSGWDPKKHCRVRSEQFTEDDYKNGNLNYLKPNAVPSIFQQPFKICECQSTLKRKTECTLANELSTKTSRSELSSTPEYIKSEEQLSYGEPVISEEQNTPDPLRNDPLNSSIKGNRIISFQYIFDVMKTLSFHNINKGCLFTHLNILSEEIDGLNSKVQIYCGNCTETFTISLTNPEVLINLDLNRGVVNRTIDNSLGYGGLKLLFDSIDVPIMSEGRYNEVLKQSYAFEQKYIKEEPCDIKSEAEDY